MFNALRDHSINTNLLPGKNGAMTFKIMKTLARDVVSMAVPF